MLDGVGVKMVFVYNVGWLLFLCPLACVAVLLWVLRIYGGYYYLYASQLKVVFDFEDFCFVV